MTYNCWFGTLNLTQPYFQVIADYRSVYVGPDVSIFLEAKFLVFEFRGSPRTTVSKKGTPVENENSTNLAQIW